MTLDEINRLRALKAKDDGIAFDLEVLKVADQLLGAAARLEQAERDHAAVLDYKLSEASKELAGVLERLYRAEKANALLRAECVAWRQRAERAEAYVAGQDVRSDFRTAAEMRAALDAALARVDALEADAMKAMHDAGVLKRFEYNRVGDTGRIEAVVQSPFMRILAEWIASDFKANGGTNYVEQELSLQLTDHADYQRYNVLVQKAGGKTPAQVAGELRNANALLRAECVAWRAITLHPGWTGTMPVGYMVATDAAGILKGGE